MTSTRSARADEGDEGNLQGFYRASSDFEIFSAAVLIECRKGMRTVYLHVKGRRLKGIDICSCFSGSN